MVTKMGTADGETLVGSKLKDKLWGEGGNDTLKGLQGDDKLWGGSGKDTFVFGKDSGKDTIYDAEAGDTIQIAKGLNGIKKPADVIKHAVQKGKDVIIDLGGGNKITLKDISLKDLKKSPGDHFDIS